VIGPYDWNIMYVVMLVVLAGVFLKSAYNVLPLMPRLTAHLVSVIIETKNRTLEETGILFDCDDGANKPLVSATQISTHSSEEDEKEFHVYMRD
jgi:hypothetical protein